MRVINLIQWTLLFKTKELVENTKKTFTFLKSAMKTLGSGDKYVQSYGKKHQNDVIDVVLVFLWLTLDICHTLV